MPFRPAQLQRLSNAIRMRQHFSAPVLRTLRGKRTLGEAAKILGIRNLSTIHHWESGRREVPFAQWLKAVDRWSGRLDALVASLPFELSLDELGFDPLPARAYSEFFSDPWTPMLMLSLRLPMLSELKSAETQARFLSSRLELPLLKVETSLDLLIRLRLARLESGRLVSDEAQLYAIPAVSPERIQAIHRFWFENSLRLLEKPGFHKVEQHALSRESRDRVIGWITELRERIREEVRTGGDPETLIHINWQVAELL